MIQIKNLCKEYDGIEILHDISLTVDTGEIYGIVGASGEGKSTLLRCINGLETYKSGSLSVDGIEVASLDETGARNLRRNMGMVFQNFSLIKRKSVYHNIALPMECWQVSDEKIKAKVEYLAEVVGIADKLNMRPDELSGGQMQRVAIARALTMDPKYILCDECTSALDPQTTLAILELLGGIRRELGVTIIMVTHEMQVVQSVCDRMAIVANGKIAKEGIVSDIFFENPIELRRLLGNKTIQISPQEALLSFETEQSAEGEILWELGRLLDKPYTVKDALSYTSHGKKMAKITIAFDVTMYSDVENYISKKGTRCLLEKEVA